MSPNENSVVKNINRLSRVNLFNMIVVLLMGFASGLPLALTSASLQAWYTDAGVDIVTIGILTLVGQPYVYKFFWAPLQDRFSIPLLGRRRGWILAMQICLISGLVWMSSLDPAEAPGFLALVALFVAIFSATQDIAIDAYRTEILAESERGLGSAMTTAGYRLAMLTSGGLALVLADHIGWAATYLFMAGLMVCGCVVTLMAKMPKEAIPPKTLKDSVVEPFKALWQRRSILWILLFVVAYKLGDAFALSLGTPFLIRGLGFSLTDVGAIYKTVGIVASIAGSFVGGMIMTRIKIYTALWYFGILQCVSNFMFMLLAVVGKSYSLMVATIFIENFCGGLGAVAFIAFLMGLCDRRYTATQYALLSALAVIGRVFIGPLAGIMAANMSWAYFYFCSVIISLPGLILLWLLRHRIQAAISFAPQPA